MIFITLTNAEKTQDRKVIVNIGNITHFKQNEKTTTVFFNNEYPVTVTELIEEIEELLDKVL